MQSDALQKIRFALRYVEVPGNELLRLREAYAHWLCHIKEADLPNEVALRFRAVMHGFEQILMLNESESPRRTAELIAKLKVLEEALS